ncbi:MAG: hypothetical protein HYW05_03275 [Candidatus Diapherotrites archaeon]|nr:hypothetical protein [Candidatus Diapherotrites archaeon]
MPVNPIIPQLNTKQNTTKDAIISILSQEWPLSAKEIYGRTKRQLSLNVSYQAIHKSLKQLEENRIIYRAGAKYELNKDWISNIKKFSTNLEKLYNKEGMIYDIDPNFKGTIKLEFNDFSVLSVFIAELLANRILAGDSDPTAIAWFRHMYWPLRFNFKDFAILQGVARNCKKTYAIVSLASPFDKWLQKQFLRAGVSNVKIGTKEQLFDDSLYVQGDCIIEVVSSAETKQILDEVYNRNKNLTDLFREVYFRNTLKTPMHFDLTITRNPDMAKFLKKQLMKYFR